MQNTITLDANSGLIQLSTLETQTNEIWIEICGPTTNSKVEIYYGANYQTSIGLDGAATSQMVKIPTRYCSDGEIIRFRYVDEQKISKFVYILGDQSAFENLVLKKITSNIYDCGGIQPTSEEVDYLELLAKLIGNSSNNIESCYKALQDLESKLNVQLLRLNGEPGSTMSESVANLASVEGGNNLKPYVCIINRFTLQKFTDKSMNVKLTEVTE